MTGILSGWPVSEFRRLTGARVPIIQAPMAGAGGVALAVAAIRGGAVGSLPCAMLTPDQVRDQVAAVKAAAVDGPLNLNFFCHRLTPPPDEDEWRNALAPFYKAENVGPPQTPPPLRAPFDNVMCRIVEELRPPIVSFHFGLPEPDLLDRVRETGAVIVGNATTRAEAHLLTPAVDLVVAQGFEAGGHAGYFLDGYTPQGTLALVRQVALDAEPSLVPVVAAGGIADAAGIASALMLGAGAVQLGTAYLHSAEATISAMHRASLGTQTVVTNLFSGGLARGARNRLIDMLGPVHSAAPHFPYASGALADLRRVAEGEGRGDYSPLWAGQAAALGTPISGHPAEGAQALTERLAREASELLGGPS